MSSIGPGIAGSVSQAMLQQSQVAKARDAVRNRDDRQAQRLRDELEKHIESVEDSAEIDSEHVRVNPDQREEDQRDRKRQAQKEYQQQQQSPEDENDATHIDIEA